MMKSKQIGMIWYPPERPTHLHKLTQTFTIKRWIIIAILSIILSFVSYFMMPLWNSPCFCTLLISKSKNRRVGISSFKWLVSLEVSKSLSYLLMEQVYNSLFLLFYKHSCLQLFSSNLWNSSFLISHLLTVSFFYIYCFYQYPSFKYITQQCIIIPQHMTHPFMSTAPYCVQYFSIFLQWRIQRGGARGHALPPTHDHHGVLWTYYSAEPI